MSKTLHLMTQRGQPMGSERRCCENCGLMMVGRDAAFWREHSWTDEPANYKDGPAEGEDFTTCDTVRSKPAAYSDVVSDGGMDPRNAADARAAKPQPAPGFVLVPTIPNRDMDRIMQAEDWQWADVLAAAGTATEAEIAATSQDADDATRMAFLADNWKSEIEGKRLHDWLGDIGTLLRHGSLRKAIDFARTPPAEAAS